MEALALQPVVTAEDREGVTSFLQADPATFRYSYGPLEKEIIRLFASYRETHPVVASVYMGREDGAFVRSHPRPSPTAYDPRTRPWYQAAWEAPGGRTFTEPYRAVTSEDINIGVVRALWDLDGNRLGVLGMDVTLGGLSAYMAGLRLPYGGKLLLLDTLGMIISSEDKSLLLTPAADYVERFFEATEGTLPSGTRVSLPWGQAEIMVEKLSFQGWRALVLLPSDKLDAAVLAPFLLVTGSLAAGFVFLTLLALAGIQRMIVARLKRFSDFAQRVAESGALELRLDAPEDDEIGDLQRSWNGMLESLQTSRDHTARMSLELMRHRDHLEAEVEERTKTLLREKERAEAADRVKSSFLATMSHELRTPLNSILGFTGILLKGLVGPLSDEQSKQLQMVKGSAQHLLALINDVLDISKIEAGELKVVHEPFELSTVVQKAVVSILPQAQKKGLHVSSSMEPESLEMHGDARRVEQILLNLLSNAVKFTEQSSVTVKVKASDSQVDFSVEDTGIGIKEEDQELLFRAFRQIDSGLTRKYEGTGLGLSICKKLVELMGGCIRVSSRLGQGTVFSFFLPKEVFRGSQACPDY